MPGRTRELTTKRVIHLLESGNRPVWSVSDIAEHENVARVTAQKRMDELVEDGLVETVHVANATAYYLPGVLVQVPGDDVEAIKRDLRRAWTDRFVGLRSDPTTAVHPNDGPATAGDEVQILTEGEPGDWREVLTVPAEDRRQQLESPELVAGEIQALVSGTLYAKPTVPAAHIDFDRDYSLEQQTGATVRDVDGRDVFVAAGPKNYLVRPHDEAVFLTDVAVDFVSPLGAEKGVGTDPEPDELEAVVSEAVESLDTEHEATEDNLI